MEYTIPLYINGYILYLVYKMLCSEDYSDYVIEMHVLFLFLEHKHYFINEI